MNPRPIGAKRLAPPPRAAVSLPFRIPESRLSAIRVEPQLPRFAAVLLNASREAEIPAERDKLIARLESWATGQGVGRKELAVAAGFSWGTWRRLRDGRASAADWLPQLRAAAARLSA